MNCYNEPKEVVERFISDNKYKHQVLLMGSALADDPFAVTTVPTNYYIDHTGTVVARENGFHEEMVPRMEERILDLIAKRKAALEAKKSD